MFLVLTVQSIDIDLIWSKWRSGGGGDHPATLDGVFQLAGFVSNGRAMTEHFVPASITGFSFHP